MTIDLNKYKDKKFKHFVDLIKNVWQMIKIVRVTNLKFHILFSIE